MKKWDGSWHNTTLRAIQDCGEYFRRRFVEGEEGMPTLRLHRGSVVARVVADAHKRQMEVLGREHDGDPSPLVNVPGSNESRNEARDFAASYFDDDLTTRGYTLEPGETPAAIGRAKDMAVGLAELYVGDVAPLVNPVAVERKITLKPKDTDLVLHGTLDLVDLRKDGEWVRDQKTGERSPASGLAHTSQQLTFYHMLRTAEVGKEPAGVALDYLVRTPVKGDRKHVVLTSSRTPEDVAALAHRINHAVDAVKRGVFIPASPENWKCSPRWCEYHATCKYAQGRKTWKLVEGGLVE